MTVSRRTVDSGRDPAEFDDAVLPDDEDEGALHVALHRLLRHGQLRLGRLGRERDAHQRAVDQAALRDWGRRRGPARCRCRWATVTPEKSMSPGWG